MLTELLILSTDSFKDRLLSFELFNDTWYKTETGRFICASGRSYSKTKFSWTFNDDEVKLTNSTLASDGKCDPKGGCNQDCLRNLVSKAVSIGDPGPRGVLMKYSACSNGDIDVKDDEYFDYITLLMFGKISASNEGNYSLTIVGNFGKFFDVQRVSKGEIFVTKAVVDSTNTLKIGNLTVPDKFRLLLTHQQSTSIQCLITDSSNDTTPLWLKDDKFIEQHSNISCSGTALKMFYTVETKQSTTKNYNDSYTQVDIFLFNATLHLCHVTEESQGLYRCTLPHDRNVNKAVNVTVNVPPSLSPGEDGNTQQLLIIWFAMLNGVLIVAITVTLVVWCWMRHSVNNKQKHVHTTSNIGGGLPAYLHNYLELETTFTQDGSDPLEFPFDHLEFLDLLGLCGEHLTYVWCARNRILIMYV